MAKSLSSPPGSNNPKTSTVSSGEYTSNKQFHDSYQSFSGADYKVMVYLPISNDWDSHWKLRELQDEIDEYEYELSSLEAGATLGEYPEASITARQRSLESVIAKLTKRKASISGTKNSKTSVILDSLQTLSYQIHRGRKPVRSLGAVYPKSYTSGPRVISGSMIFTVFNEHPLTQLMDTINTLYTDMDMNSYRPKMGSGRKDQDLFMPSSSLTDEIPPLDIVGMAVNEHGSAAHFHLLGVRLLNDGQVISSQDMITETTVNFVAQDIDLMRTLDTRGDLKILAIDRKATASDLLTSRAYLARKLRRNYPF